MFPFSEDVLETVRQLSGRVELQRYEETLRQLVSIPSPSGEEGEVARWIERQLRKVGVSHIQVDEYDNVVAEFGSGKRRLLISAHTDTPAPQPAMEAPYTPYIREENGERKLYGLGAASTKGCLASIIEAITVLISAGVEIPRTTFLAVSCDLHPSRHGIKDAFRKHTFEAEAVLVGEPTNGRIGIGARGYAHVEVTFTGQPHHAGRPDNLKNPVAGVAAFIQRALAEPLPEHPLLGPASLTPLLVDSEGQRPQTPLRASALIDRRLIPSDPDVEELLDCYRGWAERYSDALDVELTLRRHQFPWIVSQKEPIVVALAESYRVVHGSEPEFYPLPFSSSSGFIKHTTGMTPVAYSGGYIGKIGPGEYATLSTNVTAARVIAGALVLFNVI